MTIKHFFKSNQIYIILLALIIYSIGFFSIINFSAPKLPKQKVVVTAIQGELSEEEQKEEKKQDYMTKLEEKLRTNTKFQLLSLVMGFVLLSIVLVGILFIALYLLFKALKIDLFKLRKVKLSYYLKFGFADLVRFIIVYSAFYCFFKHIILSEIIFCHVFLIDIKVLGNFNIYLAAIVLNILPCVFLISYIKNKYCQGMHFLGLHFKDIKRHFVFGVSSYITFYPIFFFVVLVTFTVVQYFKSQIPTHPIVPIIIEESSKFKVMNLVILSCLIGPITEEIFFRGVVYPFVRRNMGCLLAAGLSALFFACMHMSIPLVFGIFVMGLLFAYLYETTGSLMSCIFVHILHNTTMILWTLGIKLVK